MSDSAPLGNLPIYIARTWTTGESMTRTKFQSEFDQAEALLTLCKTALADIQNRRHGTSSPTENAIAGQIWAKKISAARTQWFGDPDAAGADDQFLTENEAYNADAKTAGTGTFKVGGAVNVDATADSAPFSADYNLPADTLSANNDVFSFLSWGTSNSSGTGLSSFTPTATFGSTTSAHVVNDPTDNISINWICKCFVIRTGAATQKMISYCVLGADSASVAKALLVRVASPTEDSTAIVLAGVAGSSTGFIGADSLVRQAQIFSIQNG